TILRYSLPTMITAGSRENARIKPPQQTAPSSSVKASRSKQCQPPNRRNPERDRRAGHRSFARLQAQPRSLEPSPEGTSPASPAPRRQSLPALQRQDRE